MSSASAGSWPSSSSISFFVYAITQVTQLMSHDPTWRGLAAGHRCFSLEHNTRSVFNSLYETETLAGILEAQYRDDYQTLLRYASEAVRGAGGLTSAAP